MENLQHINKFQDWLDAAPTEYGIDASYYETNKDYVRDCISPKDAFCSVCGEEAFWDLVNESLLEGIDETTEVSRDILEAEKIIYDAFDAT